MVNSNQTYFFFNLNFQGEGDVFEAELLPSYAKSYILPRRMRRVSVVVEEDGNSKPGSRRQSYARKQSMVTPEFQMSMLRASLEEKQIVSSSKNSENPELDKVSSLSFGNRNKSR